MKNIQFTLSPRLEGGNGMEMNEKNNFRIFFHSLVWEQHGGNRIESFYDNITIRPLF